MSNLTERAQNVLSELEDMGVLANGITLQNVIEVAVSAMEIVDDFDDLKGAAKKQLVLNVLDLAIEKYVVDSDLVDNLKTTIESVVSMSIDKIIDASLNKLKVNAVKVADNLLTKCIPCLK